MLCGHREIVISPRTRVTSEYRDFSIFRVKREKDASEDPSTTRGDEFKQKFFTTSGRVFTVPSRAKKILSTRDRDGKRRNETVAYRHSTYCSK